MNRNRSRTEKSDLSFMIPHKLEKIQSLLTIPRKKTLYGLFYTDNDKKASVLSMNSNVNIVKKRQKNIENYQNFSKTFREKIEKSSQRFLPQINSSRAFRVSRTRKKSSNNNFFKVKKKFFSDYKKLEKIQIDEKTQISAKLSARNRSIMIGQLKKNVRKSDRSYSSVMFTESHNSNRNELTEASTPKEEKIQNDISYSFRQYAEREISKSILFDNIFNKDKKKRLKSKNMMKSLGNCRNLNLEKRMKFWKIHGLDKKFMKMVNFENLPDGLNFLNQNFNDYYNLIPKEPTVEPEPEKEEEDAEEEEEEGTFLPTNITEFHSYNDFVEDTFGADPKKFLEIEREKRRKRRKNSLIQKKRKKYLKVKRKKRRKTVFQDKISQLDTLFKTKEPSILAQMKKKLQSKKILKKKNRKGSNTPKRKKNRKKRGNVRETRLTFHQFTIKPQYMMVNKNRPFTSLVEFKGPVGKMNNWTMHNKTNYYSYWMEQIDKMLSSQVENLRYYEDIGYYYPMREEIPPMRERPTKKFSDLPVIFQAHNIIIEHIYEKISIDLLFESKEIDCDVKRKAFGVNKKKIEEKILKNEHLDSDMTTPQTLSSFSPMSKSRVDINFEEMLKSRKKLKKRKPQGSAQEIAERMRKKRINEQINSHIFNMDTTNSKPKYLFENANKDKEFGPILKEFFARNEKLLKLQQGGKVDKDGNILKIDLLEYQREFEVYGKEVYKFPSDEEEEEKLSSMGEILEEKFEFQIKLHQATEKVLEESESCGSDIEEMSGQLLRTRKKIHSEGNLLIHVSPIFQRKELSQNG